MVHQLSTVLAAAAVLLLGGSPARAEAPHGVPARSCTGIYSGAARGIFKCKVTAVQRPGANRSAVTLDLADDIQLSGDALQATLGGLEWTGDLTVGSRSLRGDTSAVSGGSYLQTGLPPTPSDYVAAKDWAKYAVDQGDVAITITSVSPGPTAGDGSRTYEVHGTFSAKLLPHPAAGHAVGAVRISASF